MAAATRQRTRKQRSQETSDRILAEACGLIADCGLDRSSAVALAQRCGLSTGPIYARYDTVEDVAVELWQTSLHAHLEMLLRLLRFSVAGDGEPARQLAAELSRPTSATAAVCELAAVARRYPQLAEQIRADLGDLLREHCAAQSNLPEAVSLGQVTFLLGSVMLSPIVSPEPKSRWMGCLGLLGELSRDAGAHAVPSADPQPTVMQMPKSNSGDALRDELVEAVMVTVSRVGFEHATATRIARHAHRGFSSFYSEFPSKDEMLVSVVADLIEQMVRISVRGFAEASRAEFVAASVSNARGLVADLNRENRHLRVEVMVAARHHAELAVVARRLFNGVRREAERGFSPAASSALTQRASSYWTVIRSNNIGMSVLASATPALERVDWTPASAALASLLASMRG